MPQISSMDATYHSAKDLFYALQNTSLARPLFKIGHLHKEALRNLAEVFRKVNPPATPPRVPVREVGQKKLQEVNQEGNQMKSVPQSNPFTNAEPMRVNILEVYSDELQPLNPAKNEFFNQSEARI